MDSIKETCTTTIQWIKEGIIYTLKAILYMVLILMTVFTLALMGYITFNTTPVPVVEGEPSAWMFTDTKRLFQ